MKKWLVQPVAETVVQMLYLETTIILQYAAKCFMCISDTKKRLKGQDLIKFIIFPSALSGTF